MIELFRITDRAGNKHPSLWDEYATEGEAIYFCPPGYWVESFYKDKPDVFDIGHRDTEGVWHAN